MICVRPVLQSPIPQKSFIKPLKRHRHSTTITCRYFIMIVTGFQQNIALKQSRCLTVAQPAAKRSIRADLPFARQSKKKCGIFYEPGMRNGNKPTDGLLWYLRRAVLFLSQTILPRPYHIVIFSLTFSGTSIKPKR